MSDKRPHDLNCAECDMEEFNGVVYGSMHGMRRGVTPVPASREDHALRDEVPEASGQALDMAWAMNRLSVLQACFETNAGRFGKKLLRGEGYPNEIMSEAQDALALRMVIDALSTASPAPASPLNDEAWCRKRFTSEDGHAVDAGGQPASPSSKQSSLRARIRAWREGRGPCWGEGGIESPVGLLCEAADALAEAQVAKHKLRAAFDDMLIAEVHRYGGIPHLQPEEIGFREVLAEFLLNEDKEG